MKSCPQCQYPNPDSRKDCFKCGVPLDGSALPKEQAPQPVAESPFAQPGPYSGPGQPPPGYQSPNSAYSTPIVLTPARSAPVNRGLLLGIAIIIVCLMSWGINAYISHSFVKAMDKGTSEKNYTVMSCVPQLNSLGMPTIAGQICNNSPKDVLMAMLSIDMYDAAGKKIGTTTATIMNWLPKQNIDYEALIEDPTVASTVSSAKVVKVKMISER